MGCGVVRLLVTSGGRTLCLAGAVDDTLVDGFHRRYGHEPAPIDRVEAGSVTWLSPAAVTLVRDHLRAADRAGRPVAVWAAPEVAGSLDGDRGSTAPRPMTAPPDEFPAPHRSAPRAPTHQEPPPCAR